MHRGGTHVDFDRRTIFLGAAACAVSAMVVEARTAGRKSSPTGRLSANVRDFGARGDGRNDDRAAIQQAIDWLADQGGGVLRIPAGVFVVDRSDAGPFALQLKDRVSVIGEGAASVLKLADRATERTGSHTLYVDRAEDITLSNLVIDGNRRNQKHSGHCLKSDGVDGLLLRNVIVRNAFSYGLGFQDGVNRRIKLENVVVQDTGADGIDFKNRQNGNAQIELRNVAVRRWGLRKDLEIQAGIDCRGPILMANILVSEPGSESAVGIRMRQGKIGQTNGLGGHFSRLHRFEVRMGTGRAQIGVNVVARFVTVSQGSVFGGLRGMVVQGSNFRGESVRIGDCSDVGLLVDAAGSGLDGDSTIISNCNVSTCGSDGIQVEADDVQILNCVSSRNGRHGLAIEETARATKVVGGDYSMNRAGRIKNRGSNSRIAVSAV